MQESMSLTWYVCSHALPFGTGTLFPFKAERRRLWRVAPVTHTREVCITIGLHHQQRTAGLAWGHMTILCGAIQCMTPRGGCHRARRKTKPAVSPASRLIETTFTTLPSLTKRTLLSFSLCIAAVSFHHGIAIAFPDPPHTERSGSLALPRPSPSTSILPYLPTRVVCKKTRSGNSPHRSKKGAFGMRRSCFHHKHGSKQASRLQLQWFFPSITTRTRPGEQTPSICHPALRPPFLLTSCLFLQPHPPLLPTIPSTHTTAPSAFFIPLH